MSQYLFYKDKQKKDAFEKITHACDALNLHPILTQRAKELFSGFRDDREKMVDFNGVVAACLCEAHDQVYKNKKGSQQLKGNPYVSELHIVHQQQVIQDKASIEPTKFNVRASRRLKLHSTSLAAKGNFLLHMDNNHITNNNSSGNGVLIDDPDSTFDKKDVSTWDLHETRSWLIYAVRKIARQWYQNNLNNNSNATKNDGNDEQLEQLEGLLLGKIFLLCNALEEELETVNNTKGLVLHSTNPKEGKNRIVIPRRVKDIGNLGIQWQYNLKCSSRASGRIGMKKRRLRKDYNIRCQFITLLLLSIN